MRYEELISRLRAGEYTLEELSIILPKAADAIEELRGALLLMVLQYCTTDDGVLYHSFMSAGENAFAVLGLKNGRQADPLWDRLLPLKEQAEEGE